MRPALLLESERQFRARARAEIGSRLELAGSPFLFARAKAARKRRKLAGQIRAVRCQNVMGQMIWSPKPRLFGGKPWLRRRATIGD